MDAPFITDDSMADSGTAINLLKQKFPGMFADAAPAPNPLFNSGAPTIPASTSVDPNAIPQPDLGNKADKLSAIVQGGLSAATTPQNKFNLPWLPGYKAPQPAPSTQPLTDATGRMVPGLNWKQRLGVLGVAGAKGAMRGLASDEQAVLASGGRRSGGAGLGFEAGYTGSAQESATQQALQRGSLENQTLQNQVTYAPQKFAADYGKTMSDIQKNLADAGKMTAEAGAIPARVALEKATALAARYKEDAGSGQLIDLQTGKPYGNSSGLAPLTAEEARVLGKEEGDRVPVKLKNTANEMVNRGFTTINTEQGVYERNRGTGAMTRLGNNPREITLDTPVGALDSTTHKQVMVTKKDINANPGRYAPVSADVSTPAIKQTLKEYSSTKPNTAGGQVIAFNTAILHLGLLADAADALGNGNAKLFNSISQKWKEQTGSPLPARFDTIKQMASGEITKVGGSLNQGEQEAVKGPLDKSNSPQALKGSIGASVQLMDGKISILHQHYVDVMHEEPDAPLVYPEAQKVRDRLLGGSQGGGPKFSQVKPGVMVEQ